MPSTPLFWQSDAIVASPAAGAETVICRTAGVATQHAGQQIKLSGAVNVTPDTDATALVLRVRRHNLTGTLVAPAQTIALGSAGLANAMVLQPESEQIAADAATTVACDGASHPVACLVAAPPAWMDNAGNIIEPGLYGHVLGVSAGAAATAPGLFATAAGAFAAVSQFAIDPITSVGAILLLDVASLAAADLPWSVTVNVHGQNDATATLACQPIVYRYASAATGGGGAGDTDARADVIDSPGSVAGGAYVLTAQMTGANSPSVVNAVALTARVD